MFSKSESKTADVARPNPTATGARAAPSIISANLHIVGNLKTEGEIQVDGVIDGDVSAQSLTIGAHARISGELVAEDVVVHGQIHGKITARTVRLAKTAKVIGDILHDVLAIEAGAHIEGQLKRKEEEKEKTRPKVVSSGDAPEAAAS